jgi:hypothetical protein
VKHFLLAWLFPLFLFRKATPSNHKTILLASDSHLPNLDKVRASPAASTANPFYPRNPRLIRQSALFGKRISNKSRHAVKRDG